MHVNVSATPTEETRTGASILSSAGAMSQARLVTIVKIATNKLVVIASVLARRSHVYMNGPLYR